MTPEERKARDEAQQRDVEAAMGEQQAAQEAVRKNMERLNSERLARDTGALDPSKSKIVPGQSSEQ